MVFLFFFQSITYFFLGFGIKREAIWSLYFYEIKNN